eukprot:scaffold4883_cov119-Isochrysis_galbana.AAC.3
MAWGKQELDVDTLLLRVRGSRALHLMPSRKLDGAGCVRLCSALVESPETLTELDLSGHCIGAEGARAIGRLLAVPGCALERLGVGDASFGASGVHALAEAIGGATSSLRTLDLQNRGLDREAAEALGSLCSKSLSHLRELKLALNPLGDPGMCVLLGVAGAGLRLLEVLDVSKTLLTAVGASSLSGAVSASGECAMPSLTQLDVSSNHLSDDGASALGLLLQAAAPRLKDLRARACGIGRAGAAILGQAAGQSGARLRVLDLEENPEMGDAGCAALAEGLQRWVASAGAGGPTAELKLGSCGCADAGAAALARVRGIECLALPHSRVSAAGTAAVLTVRGLRRLQLFDNSAIGQSINADSYEETSASSTNGSVEAICAALYGADALEDLDLGACALADPGLLAALADASCAPRLGCLELNGNPLHSAACARALATLRDRRPKLDVVWRPPPEPLEKSSIDARVAARGGEEGEADEPPAMADE